MIFNVFWLSHSRATVFSLSNNHASPSITPIRQVPFLLRWKTPLLLRPETPSLAEILRGVRGSDSPFYTECGNSLFTALENSFFTESENSSSPFSTALENYPFSGSHSFNIPPAKILSHPLRGLRFMQQFAFEIPPPMVRVGFRILGPPARRKP